MIRSVLDEARLANDRISAVNALKRYDGAALDEEFVRVVDEYVDFLQAGKKKIASVDPARLPTSDEFIVLFGNYNPCFENLILNNPATRNVLDFWTMNLEFDQVERDICWASVDKIYIINLNHRTDRYYSCLRELTRMGAPLDAIQRFPAEICDISPDKQLNGHLGCLQSHLAVIEIALRDGLQHALILEDDFCFTDNIPEHKWKLGTFFERNYDFDICLLSTSKRGLIVPKDDLVCETRQKCTNAGAYLVSASGLRQLERCFSEALKKLKETGDHFHFAADKCWGVLQGSRFLVFRQRLGFQVPSFSDIEGKMAEYFD